MKDEITVSISCTTYNHSKYIRECLDGFLMQQCNFKFEVLIHDDASTDGTIEIIKEYQEKYPELIKPYIQRENQWSKGVRGMNAKYNFSRAKGKYIALCEGDDYWIDPLKLQKQVDFLVNNKDYAGIFHNSYIVNNDSDYEYINGSKKVHYNIRNKAYSKLEISNDWIIPTNSIVFEKSILENYKFHNDIIFSDILLFLNIVNNGKVYGMEDLMSCYRRHNGGVSFEYSLDLRKKLIKQSFKLQELFNLKLNKRIAKEYWNLSIYYLKKKQILKFLYYQLKSLKIDIKESFKSSFNLLKLKC